MSVGRKREVRPSARLTPESCTSSPKPGGAGGLLAKLSGTKGIGLRVARNQQAAEKFLLADSIGGQAAR